FLNVPSIFHFFSLSLPYAFPISITYLLTWFFFAPIVCFRLLFALYNIPRVFALYHFPRIFPEISKGPDLWAFLTFLTTFKLQLLVNLLLILVLFSTHRFLSSVI